jgi:hypothetical protein
MAHIFPQWNVVNDLLMAGKSLSNSSLALMRTVDKGQ